MKLEFPVYLLTDEGRRGTNFVTTPARDMLIVCRTEASAIKYRLKATGLLEPVPATVPTLEVFRGVLSAIEEDHPSMKWLLVHPEVGEGDPIRMRISTFLRVQKER